jgi:hypothetical protein
MLSNVLFYLILVTNIVALPAIGQSLILTIEPSHDNTIFSENTLESNGSGSHIFSGKIQNGGALRRALIKFDLAALPSDAQIDSVQLWLYVYRSAKLTSKSHLFELHRLTSNWGEGTSNGNGSGAAAQIGDATWSQSFYPSTNWITSGGDYDTFASATTTTHFSDFPITKAIWESSQMITDITNWKNLPTTNFGWVLIGEESTDGSAKGFFSRDTPSPFNVYRPKLNIYYTLPPIKSVLVNEVNPNKQWIELINPNSGNVDVSSYSVQNGSNMSFLSDLEILSGDLILDSSEYVVLKWPEISKSIGELGLYTSDTISGDLIDYMQYGGTSQEHSEMAISQNLWDNSFNSLAIIVDSTLSYSLNPNNTYLSGNESSFSNWINQRETPAIANYVCPNEIILKHGLVSTNFYSTGSIEIMSIVGQTQHINTTSEGYILIYPGSDIQLGSNFVAEIGNCPN